MTEQEEIIDTIKVLRKEVEVLTTRLKPSGTGYLHTTIDTLNSRIDELIGAAIDGNPDQVRGLARKIFDEDVYDGYKEHTEAMEQARLKKIQDYNSGQASFKKSTMWSANKEGHWSPDENIEEKHVPDTVEHTKEYYDTQRNRPMEGEDLPITEGLSNRSMKTMKEIYGQAVQTTSEMMQDELEPLPINTFE